MKYIVEVKPLSKPRHWILTQPFAYKNIHIRKGFITDGASVPVGLRWVFPHGGSKFAAAVVHDYLYKTGVKTRKEADQIFYDIMIENGVPKWKAKSMYLGVRAGGWLPWRNHRKVK